MALAELLNIVTDDGLSISAKTSVPASVPPLSVVGKAFVND